MKKIKIVGAGLFGCCTAYELNKEGYDVTIIEKSSDIMNKASKYNHNRIHFGYHYPRSIDTARQSLDGLDSFLKNYKDSIVSNFPNYYMIAKQNSKVTASEYIKFCDELNLDYTLNDYPNNLLVDKDMLDISIKVNELIYDYDILKSLVKSKINDINIKFNTEFDGDISDCDYLINTSYANINKINSILGIPKLNLKFQDVVIPVFEMNHKPFGLTVMDGPFCSIMPKGNNSNQFLLYNAKHSIISESVNNDFGDSDFDLENIYNQSKKYFPFLSDVKPLKYWRTIRALPVNNNDARISEIFRSKSHPKIISILSGKITTCHKVGIDLKNTLWNQ